jgi:ATP-dependent DNA ligase
MLTFPIKPMLLDSAKEPFDSEDHLFEWKVDGVRCIMFFDQGQVRLQSRNGRDCTESFPELVAPLISAKEAIFDGEITILIDGKPNFEVVMSRYHAGAKKAKLLAVNYPAYYIIWDIIWHDGKSIANMPLLERKAILNQVLNDSDTITKIDWVDTNGMVLWQAVTDYQLEGMVAKKKDSKYEFKRSHAWVKIKNYQETVVNVLGYKQNDGYLLVGTDNHIQGHALGMSKGEKAALWEIISRYGNIEGNTVWLPHGIRGRVRYTTWTPKGNMRDCHWIGFEV